VDKPLVLAVAGEVESWPVSDRLNRWLNAQDAASSLRGLNNSFSLACRRFDPFRQAPGNGGILAASG
jgi:hypothetical protein